MEFVLFRYNISKYFLTVKIAHHINMKINVGHSEEK
jgi:hypothetical protein